MKNITKKFILWGTFNVGLASVNRLSNDLALALIQTLMQTGKHTEQLDLYNKTSEAYQNKATSSLVAIQRPAVH